MLSAARTVVRRGSSVSDAVWGCLPTNAVMLRIALMGGDARPFLVRGLATLTAEPTPKVAVHGGGNMAYPMVQAMVGQGMQEQVVVAGRGDKLVRIADDLSVKTTSCIKKAAKGADLHVVSIKPQAFVEVFSGFQLEGAGLSVMAGVPIAVLQHVTGCPFWARSMPNTPGSIGQGVTGLFIPPEMDLVISGIIRSTLSGMGDVVLLKEESELDIVTAASGSGPAYVWTLCEAMLARLLSMGALGMPQATSIMISFATGMVEQGVALGLEKSVATQLVEGTFSGAAAYARHVAAGTDMSTLISNVKSPGGTTIAGLEVAEAMRLDKIVSGKFSDECTGSAISMGVAHELSWQAAQETAQLLGRDSAWDGRVYFPEIADIGGAVVSAAHRRAQELGKEALLKAGVSTSVEAPSVACGAQAKDAFLMRTALEGGAVHSVLEKEEDASFKKEF